MLIDTKDRGIEVDLESTLARYNYQVEVIEPIRRRLHNLLSNNIYKITGFHYQIDYLVEKDVC